MLGFTVSAIFVELWGFGWLRFFQGLGLFAMLGF